MGCQSDTSQPVSGSAVQQRSTEYSPTAAPQRNPDQHEHQHEKPEEVKDKHVHPTPSEPSSKKPPRRFLAQPVETSSRSSQQSSQQPSTSNPASANQSQPPPVHDTPAPPRRRFLPEPIETTKTSHSNTTKPRRFKPEIIETEQRSVQGKPDVPLSNRHNARTGAAHLDADAETTHLRTRLSPNRTFSHPTESKFSYASLLRRREQSQSQSRRHSFRVPELPSIPSNSSEDSDADSEALSFSPAPEKQTQNQSAKSQQDNNDNNRSSEESGEGEAEGEGEAGGFSDYLLSVAARSAHQQLKDQALAAFPNEQVYQHYDHFAIDGDEGPSRDEKDEDEDGYGDRDWMYPPKHHLKSRRQSSADLSWELEYMRHHKEEAEQRFRVMKRKPDLRLSGPKFAERKILGPTPPMLGGDIILPQSTSPIGTFSNNNGTTQSATGTGLGIGTETDPCSGCGTLWCGPTRPNKGRGSGLWMGTCQKDEAENNQGHQMMTGIKTPMLRAGTGSGSESGFGSGFRPSPNPSISFSPDPRSRREEPSCTHTHTHSVPRSAPSHSRNSSQNINMHAVPNPNLNLTPSKPIEEEFNNSFVTQIYNYLSLGYPCVARYYDHELSKISGIKVSELRQDDLHTDAKGYVMAPENMNINSNSTDAEIKPGSDADADATVVCKRWKALRLYIQEWARQQPSMADEKRWGVPERRGSWAF